MVPLLKPLDMLQSGSVQVDNENASTILSSVSCKRDDTDLKVESGGQLCKGDVEACIRSAFSERHAGWCEKDYRSNPPRMPHSWGHYAANAATCGG